MKDIEFTIPGSGSMYIDFSRTKLYVKAKIVKGDGSDLVEADTATPVNLFFHTMWRQIYVFFQEKLLTSSSTNYGLKIKNYECHTSFRRVLRNGIK